MAVLFIITSASSVADADKQVRVDDLVYNLYADGTAEVTDYVGDGGDIIIPDYLEWSGKNYSIVSIGAWAFSHCYEITSMRIGNNVVMIGDYAFHNCFHMVSVTIPQSVQFIGESAFGATRLTDINLSLSNQFFKVVDGVLFSEDGSRLLVYPGMKADPIYHVPSGVRVIDEEAFFCNYELTELYINEGITELLFPISHCSIEVLGLPSTLESIPDILIRGASHLSTILLSEDNDHFILYDGMLCDRSLERVITIPAGVDYENLAIPEGVKELERCSGGYVVADIVSLPSTLEWIGFCAFESSEINNVVIPESVRTIDNYAFSDSELKVVTFLGVPQEICLGAFTVSSDVLIECYADEPVPLEEYVSSGTVVEYYSLDFGPGWAFSVVIDGLTYDLYPNGVAKLVGYGMNKITIPESVTYEGETYIVSSIESGLFKRSDVVSISIPGSVKNVEENMFWHCYDLESVVLGEGIEHIGDSAFVHCGSLRSIDLPSTLRVIDGQPFYLCDLLETLAISESNQFFKTVDDVLFSKDGSILYCYPGGKGDTSYVLPDTVRIIGRYAISDNDHLESLTLNDGLVSISDCSIFSCWNLRYVNIPSTVSELGEPFIRFCPYIVEIDVSEDNPWYVSVDGVMFTQDMTTLLKYPSGIRIAHYNVPEGVRGLAYSSLEYAKLHSVSFPSTLESIGDCAFQGSWLEQLIIPSSIGSIGYGAFSSSNITELVIEGTPHIEGWVFNNNPLETIRFVQPIARDLSSEFDNLNRQGYTFTGFFQDPGFERSMSLEDGIDHPDTTVYVGWELKTCIISYDLHGGENNPDNPLEYNVEMGSINLNPAYRGGYFFDGWYVLSDGQEDDVDVIRPYMLANTASITLHARWTPIQLMISFSSDVPCDLPAPMEVSFGDTVILPTVTSDDGRGLRGWFDGETMYAPGSTVTVGFTQDTVLEAVWSDTELIAMLAVSDGNAYCSVVSLDGSPIQAGTHVDITFTVLRVSTFMGFQIYKPVAVTETLTVDSDGGSLCIRTYDLENIRGSDHAVISMVAVMDGQSFGFMALDHRGEV